MKSSNILHSFTATKTTHMSPKEKMLKTFTQFNQEFEASGKTIPHLTTILELMMQVGQVTNFYQKPEDRFTCHVELAKPYDFPAFGEYKTHVFIPQQITFQIDLENAKIRFPGNSKGNIVGPYGKRMLDLVTGYIVTLHAEGDRYVKKLNVFGFMRTEKDTVQAKVTEWQKRVARFEAQNKDHDISI